MKLYQSLRTGGSKTAEEKERKSEREGNQSAMANIAVQRIKREFKEVLKSEEVCKTLLYSIFLPFETKQNDFWR